MNECVHPFLKIRNAREIIKLRNSQKYAVILSTIFSYSHVFRYPHSSFYLFPLLSLSILCKFNFVKKSKVMLVCFCQSLFSETTCNIHEGLCIKNMTSQRYINILPKLLMLKTSAQARRSAQTNFIFQRLVYSRITNLTATEMINKEGFWVLNSPNIAVLGSGCVFTGPFCITFFIISKCC